MVAPKLTSADGCAGVTAEQLLNMLDSFLQGSGFREIRALALLDGGTDPQAIGVRAARALAEQALDG
jgi:hypothetical protein